MKFILSILCIMCSVFFLEAKNKKSVEYYYDIKDSLEYSNKDFLFEANKPYGCYIKIENTTKEYEIYFQVVVSSHPIIDDIYVEEINGSLLSSGHYKENGGQIVFVDKLHGYKMYAEKLGNRLKFSKSLPWLEQKSFIYEVGQSEEIDFEIDYTLNCIRQDIRNKYEIDKTLSFGIYHGELRGINYYLEITPTGYFTSYIEKILISHGKWEKVDSEILLKDPSVNALFSVLITKNGLVSQLVPGDFEGVLLKKMTPEEIVRGKATMLNRDEYMKTEKKLPAHQNRKKMNFSFLRTLGDSLDTDWWRNCKIKL